MIAALVGGQDYFTVVIPNEVRNLLFDHERTTESRPL